MTNTWRDSSLWSENFGDALYQEGDNVWRDESSRLEPLDVNLMDPEIPSQEEYKDNLFSENYQKVNLHGFTTAELLSLNAITDEVLRPNNLEGDLHPLVARENWETEVPAHFERKDFIATYDTIPGGFDGFWAAQDDRVWAALLPSLQLVTKFLDNAHIFPFFAAILDPELEEVSKRLIYPWWNGERRTAQELADHPKLYRFRLQGTDAFDAAMVKDRLIELASKVSFGIFDGACPPSEVQPEVQEEAQHHGTTTRSDDDPHDMIRIYLAWQRIAPLMRDDLTTSMRLAEQFMVARTILHELAHCIRFWKFPGPYHLEPYFEDDWASGIGFALEKSIFGQRIVEIVQQDRFSTKTAHPSFLTPGFVFRSWPTETSAHECGEPWLLKSEAGVPWLSDNGKPDVPWVEKGEVTEENWPLSMSYVEEIQQQDFWQHFVLAWGAEAVKVTPLIAKTTYIKGSGYSVAELLPKKTRGEEKLWERWARNVTVETLLKFDWHPKTTYTFAFERLRKEKEIRAAFKDYQDKRARYKRVIDGTEPRPKLSNVQVNPPRAVPPHVANQTHNTVTQVLDPGRKRGPLNGLQSPGTKKRKVDHAVEVMVNRPQERPRRRVFAVLHHIGSWIWGSSSNAADEVSTDSHV